MAILRRITTIPVVLLTLLVASWLVPAFQRNSIVAAASKSDQVRRGIGASDVHGNAAKQHAANLLDKLPLNFEKYRERTSKTPSFIARGGGVDFNITPTEAVINLRAGQHSAVPFLNAMPPRNSHKSKSAPTPATRHQTASLRMQIVGANRRARFTGKKQLTSHSNYLIGNNPQQWRVNVPNYAQIKAEQIYRGVDVVYYGTGPQLEYDFNVAPGADWKAICLRFSGANRMAIDEYGDLVLNTPAGDIRQHKPVAYQLVNGDRRQIEARYVVSGNREIGFDIGAYDRSRPLVIDPVLSYSTYFGSATGTDSISSISFDTEGNAYVVGTTYSSDLPTTPGAFQPTARFEDAFIAKLNPSGTGVIYVTYLGGNGSDSGAGIAVDSRGQAYVAGATFSGDFPTTAGAFQSHPPAGMGHRFVAKLNSTGTSLVYSTYLGSPNEFVASISIAVDEEGQATVAGYTDSAGFPTTAGALQPQLAGSADVFVARLNSFGTGLVFSTYLGGRNADTSYTLALDREGNTYVAGRTSSIDFPTTRNAYQRERTGSTAGFVAKINSTGDRLSYSTYLGGDQEFITGLAVDQNGNAYMTGYTFFNDLATTPGAFQPVSGGRSDAFVMKLNNAGSELVYSTFLGGSNQDMGSAIAVDSVGRAYVTGRTFSPDFPLMRPLQSRKRGGPLFKSTDGGGMWDDVPALAFEINSLVIDPHVTSTLYASAPPDLIKSTDSGSTWQVIAPRLSGSLVIDPVRPGILYLVSDRTIYRSADAGATWHPKGVPTEFLEFYLILAIDPKRPDILYLGVQTPVIVPDGVGVGLMAGSQHSLFKSTDAGSSWAAVDFGRSVSAVKYLVIDPQNTFTIYAGSDADGLFKSTDDGASWFLIPNSTASFRQLIIDPINPATLYGSSFAGIFKSTNGGDSWNRALLREGRPALAIDPLNPSTIYAAFDGVNKTTDGGATWRLSLEKVFIDTILIDPKHPSTIYAPTSSTNDVFVAKLNTSGTALLYSTFLGGLAEDSPNSIAVDAFGNAYIGGITFSSNFPVTPNAYRSRGAPLVTGFVARIADPVSPRITNATITGKKLLISGEGFDAGAVITVNGADLPTQNDITTPSVLLISKRGGKQIGRGQTVTIRIRNSDGGLSDAFSFTRSVT